VIISASSGTEIRLCSTEGATAAVEIERQVRASTLSRVRMLRRGY